MIERRYSEEEVAEIFERATEAQKSSLPASRSGDGLTLAELQEVGRDVGIPSDLVARAAKSLDTKGRTHGRSILGLPFAVGRTIELERPLTESEWHQLVVDLRETFDARGKLSQDGPFKQWTNGNLQALLEPTPTGQRLRLRTRKGSAITGLTAGFVGLGVTAVMLVDEILTGALPPYRMANILVLATIVVGVLGVTALRLPGWAKLRRRQMEEIAERLAFTVGRPPAEDPPKRSPGSS